MITRVQKWGNSQGLRLSKELLSHVDIAVGAAMEVAVRDGAIVVTPVRRVRGGHDLGQLVKRIPKDYKPEELEWGDPVGKFIAVTFGPRSGHEQRGRRPALVISNDLFNRHTGLCVVCPITSTRRDYPFHVPIPDEEDVSGFVMVEQAKSVDFRARKARLTGRAPDEVLQEVLSLLNACVY